MAQYDYTCANEHDTIVERPITDSEGEYFCQEEGCGLKLKRVYTITSAPAIVFKAKGFYKTGG